MKKVIKSSKFKYLRADIRDKFKLQILNINTIYKNIIIGINIHAYIVIKRNI